MKKEGGVAVKIFCQCRRPIYERAIHRFTTSGGDAVKVVQVTCERCGKLVAVRAHKNTLAKELNAMKVAGYDPDKPRFLGGALGGGAA